MNDTHPDISRKFTELMMAKSGEERLLMGMSMFDDARAIAADSIRAANPTISARELRQQLFLRCYGHEYSEKQQAEILGRL